MNFFLIVPQYISWHYSQAFRDIKSIWKNILLFLYHFFSIPVLLKTLFSPWQRVHDSYGGGGGSFLETIIFNTIMRAVGFFVRLSFILIGCTSIVFVAVFGLAFYIAWLFLPLILIALLVLTGKILFL